MPDPIYTPSNCTPAFQLRWSLALFATADLPAAEEWLPQLQEQVERDGVRILEHRCAGRRVWQFLLSTRPPVAPPYIVKCVKGRLQHLLQGSCPNAFRRNFALASVGEARREAVEAYVAAQLGHHRMADARVQQRLAAFQFCFDRVDLGKPVFSSHGRYTYVLHLVLVHDERWCEIRDDRLSKTCDMVIKAAAKKAHRLARLSHLADHLHMVLGGTPTESPEEIALAYMNNLSYAHGMQPLLRAGYYVGTIGEYDMGAIRNAL